MYRDYNWGDIKVPSTSFLYPKLKQIMTQSKNKTILDLGCGNGEIARKLIADGFCVYGVDGSVHGIEVAERYCPGHFFVMDFEKDDFPEELKEIVFDTIISTEVIEHLYDPDSYVKLCKEILKGKGNLIISTPYHGYLKNLIISIAGKWDTHFSPLWCGGHIKFWSRSMLEKLLQQNGFVVKKFWGCGRFWGMWKSMMIEAECNQS